jgi:hypothetical protein
MCLVVSRMPKSLLLSEIVDERRLRKEGLVLAASGEKYPKAKETWIARTEKGDELGYLSLLEVQKASGATLVLQFCRVLPRVSGRLAPVYSFSVSAGGDGLRQFLRRVAGSASDPYLDSPP